MKAFGSHGLVWSPFGQAVARKLSLVFLASACLLLLSGCAALFRPTSPVLYKASCDLSPVLTLELPERIDALAGVPRSETIVEAGINKLTGREHRSADIKDWFYLRSGGVEYQVIIFYSSTGCAEWYESEKKDPPVFREATGNGLAGRVHYTEEPRADPEGGSGPMGYYLSRADFRLHNLYIRVVTKAHVAEGEKPQNDKLSNAVKDLGQMLSRAFTQIPPDPPPQSRP